ncbi:unnamed protein product [Rotaria magnacalcarata]|uniref:F-box domain-containing protein n=1 Tax=Rotaria magnacalcarata TaxID=392030 RepID=A0A816C4X5_9BILA|nr:unnamed protein product [Rotaria magnacalcarata]CAF1617155.1 unnamed protein product [Rotaria magnacalcarata]
MAVLYEKLQKLLTSYEDLPKDIITKKKLNESFFLIRGKDGTRRAWHFILVPNHKRVYLKAHSEGSTINVTDFGSFIKYRNNRDEIKFMSGYGVEPPKIKQNWIQTYYSDGAVDESIDLTYTNDDIRLCTIQRTIPQQKIGVCYHYFVPQQFHYIKLAEASSPSLARRAGLKSFDRIIFLNGVNIENATSADILFRFDTARHLPVQILVCSPATYEHYKTNQKQFRLDLPSIQHVKPVFATSTSDFDTDAPSVSIDNESFYAVRWENSNIVSTVSQSVVFKSPQYTHLNDICCIETAGQYKNGQIILKGSRHDCEKLKTPYFASKIGNVFGTFSKFFIRKTPNGSDVTNAQSDTIQTDLTIQHTHDNNTSRHHANALQHIQDRTCTTLEELPIELFYYIFTFIDIQHLYKAFGELNSRLNHILQSYKNFSLIFDNKVDPLLMNLYAPYVARLIIRTSIHCDFKQFSNLHELVLCIENSQQFAQIQPNVIPNLTRLSFLLGSAFTLPQELTWDIFSNQFPSLRHVSFGCINVSLRDSWTTSPSLQFVSILSCKPMCIPAILTVCPNLQHFQVNILYNDHNDLITSSSPLNHPLRRLTLWSDYAELTFDVIENILTYTLNIESFYLQTIYSTSLIDLAHSLVRRLHYLSRFDCYITENVTKNDRFNNLTDLHQIHPCFHRVQSIEENDKFRVLATK